jgi:hypothetical protein
MIRGKIAAKLDYLAKQGASERTRWKMSLVD